MRAFITVSDAAGHVLFRRPASEAEVLTAMHAARVAEAEAHAAMDRLEEERRANEVGEAAPT